MEKIELEIISNGMNGEGIAKKDGKVYFVEGAISGENVIAEIIKENKNFLNAKTTNVLNESEFRVIPKCEYFGKCGGCDLQHINYAKQLQIKTDNVKNLFFKHKIECEILDCVPSNCCFNYRNKLTMYFNGNSLCFFKKNSRQLVEINNCLLVDDNFNNLINKLNQFFKINREFNVSIFKGVSIRQIKEIFILNFILKKKINFNKLENYLKLNKINYSLYYCINNDTILPSFPTYFVGGIKNVYLNEFEINYPIYPLSFLQVNNYIKNIIYQKIHEQIKQYNNVLDAYSGAGLLSAILAKNNKKVYAVEINESASVACKILCKENKIENVEAICGDCDKVIPKLIKEVDFDCVILDPARAGVSKNILLSLCDAHIRKIVYLSCNPATLTRDIEILVGFGYKVEMVQPFDMFPQTANVETLVELKI